MVVPAWIEACDDEDLKPVLLDPMLALLSPSLLGDRRAFKKRRKAILRVLRKPNLTS